MAYVKYYIDYIVSAKAARGIKKLAKADGRAHENLVDEAIREYLERRKKEG